MGQQYSPAKVFQSTHPRGVRRDDPQILEPSAGFQSTHPRGVRHSSQVGVSAWNSFQSTHPRGVRRGNSGSINFNTSFQSTHPRGVRQLITKTAPAYISFNPRTREGCDHQRRRTLRRRQSFNPRTREGCDCRVHEPRSDVRCFNPRTREGCDNRRAVQNRPGTVSIHAPARGATNVPFLDPGSDHRFNPRTREGCDNGQVWRIPIEDMFQSTHPRGVRPTTRSAMTGDISFQSTHPRGVRPETGLIGYPVFGFNPRTREGCDFVSTMQRTKQTGDRFNPRTREGCDWLRSVRGLRTKSFNPRTREGCDSIGQSDWLPDWVFQSTHPRGVRHGTCATCGQALPVSIHAPARGATNTTDGPIPMIEVSIHAPARGATRSVNSCSNSRNRFNPRTREGCDLDEMVAKMIAGVFQSTHPRGVRPTRR